MAAILIGVLAVAWPVYVARSTSPPSAPAAAASPAPTAPPAVPVAPEMDQALALLDGVLVQTGTADEMRPMVQELRSAAQAGDRLGASEQLENLRSRTRLMVDEGRLTREPADAIEVALFQVDLHIGTIYPPSPGPAEPPPP